jgi:rhamnosyltransferase
MNARRLEREIDCTPRGAVVAVVVSYYPDAQSLGALLNALSPQVASVVVIDNTPDTDAAAQQVARDIQMSAGAFLLQPGSNLGIAKALNLGISAASSQGAKFVLLSDQDSLPEPGMVGVLLDIFAERVAEGAQVGCVSPMYFDQNTGVAFPFQVIAPGQRIYRSVSAESAGRCIEVLSCITSGSLIPLDVLKDVGDMRDDLFIDYVDTEWCLRARHRGYRVFGTAATRLNHCLGDGNFRIWAGRWRLYSDYSPLRLYYRFRNFVLLLRAPYIERWWKFRASWYWLGNLYAYGCWAPRRLKNLAMIAKGLLHGALGRGGPYPGP